MFYWRDQTDQKSKEQGFPGHVYLESNDEPVMLLYVSAGIYYTLAWRRVQISLPKFVQHFNWAIGSLPETQFPLDTLTCFGLCSTRKIDTDRRYSIPIKVPKRKFLGEKIKDILFMRFDAPNCEAFSAGKGLSIYCGFGPRSDSNPMGNEFNIVMPIGSKPFEMIIELYCRTKKITLDDTARAELQTILTEHLP